MKTVDFMHSNLGAVSPLKSLAVLQTGRVSITRESLFRKSFSMKCRSDFKERKSDVTLKCNNFLAN